MVPTAALRIHSFDVSNSGLHQGRDLLYPSHLGDLETHWDDGGTAPALPGHDEVHKS